MNIFKMFSKKKEQQKNEHKYKVGDMVRVHPDASLPHHIRGDENLLKQANGIGQIGEIHDRSDGLHIYVVNLVIVGNYWKGMYCLEEELELYK
jgi:hypothetical protein